MTTRKTAMPQRLEALTVRCAVCKTEGQAFELVAMPGLVGAKWIQLPPGWWMLTECLTLHVRCPRCLVVKDGAA